VFSLRSPNRIYGRKFKKISLKKQRIIIDLRIKGLSLNDIVDHFRVAYGIKITAYYIKRLIKKYSIRAKSLNRYYDSLVSEKLDIVEFDEVYQGRQGKVLGGVHKGSLYLITMDRFHTKGIEDLKQILKPIAERFPDINIVFTDLLPTYKKLIEEVFPEALHQNCYVHAIREVKKRAFTINLAAKKAYKALRKLQINLEKQCDKLRKKRRKLKRWERQLMDQESRRGTYLKLNNIKPGSRINPSDKTRIQFNKKINILRAKIRSLNRTLSNIEDSIIKYTHDIPGAEAKYKKYLVKRLQAGRLLKKFKDVLYAPPNVFNKKYERLLGLLKRKRSAFAKYMRKFMKNNPKLFTLHQSGSDPGLSANYMNTNSIESIFGRKRAFLDKYRTILGSEFQESIFEILRLHHNLSRPYTGPRKDTSPLERLGVQSKYNNYLDALFGGLAS